MEKHVWNHFDHGHSYTFQEESSTQYYASITASITFNFTAFVFVFVVSDSHSHSIHWRFNCFALFFSLTPFLWCLHDKWTLHSRLNKRDQNIFVDIVLIWSMWSMHVIDGRRQPMHCRHTTKAMTLIDSDIWMKTASIKMNRKNDH